MALDVRARVAVLGRQPTLPDVRGLDDVVVDADDLGDHWMSADCSPGFAAVMVMACPLRRLYERTRYRMNLTVRQVDVTPIAFPAARVTLD